MTRRARFCDWYVRTYPLILLGLLAWQLWLLTVDRDWRIALLRVVAVLIYLPLFRWSLPNAIRIGRRWRPSVQVEIGGLPFPTADPSGAMLAAVLRLADRDCARD